MRPSAVANRNGRLAPGTELMNSWLESLLGGPRAATYMAGVAPRQERTNRIQKRSGFGEKKRGRKYRSQTAISRGSDMAFAPWC